MLYASTVATLKREFGLTYISQEIRTSSAVKFEILQQQKQKPGNVI